MKRIRWGRTRAPRTGRYVGIALLAAAALLLLARFAAPNLFLAVASPFFGASSGISNTTHGFFASFGNARAVAEKNTTLMQENAALSLENRTLEERLADISPLAAAASGGITAGVLARPPVAPYDTFILGAGAQAGVARGMEAFGTGGIPLGFVTASSASFSRVTLFSAPGTESTAWVGALRVPVTLVGAGAGAFTASVPRAATVAVGDGVFVPGPGALPVGTVSKVGGDASSPVATIYIRPAVNPFSITWVLLRDTGQSFMTASSTAL